MQEIWKIFHKIITYQSWNNSHTETETMKWKQFDNTNIENL